MTYYKYENANTPINWAEVGKNMSDMLTTEADNREKKKEAYDKGYRDDQKWANENIVLGNHPETNARLAEMSVNLPEYNRLQFSLLKKGQLSQQEYTANRQNARDSAQSVLGLGKKFQAEYDIKMPRYESAKSSFREPWEMASAEGLSKMKNVRIVMDDNGNQIFMPMVLNPKTGIFEVSKNPNDAISVLEMESRLNSQWDRFDVGLAATNAAAQLGAIEKTVLNSAKNPGDIDVFYTDIDAKKGSQYKNWENDQIGVMMSNPNNISSILVDLKLNTTNTDGSRGEKYVFTYDKEAFKKDKTGSLIYINREEDMRGVAEFKPEQIETVRKTLETAIQASIDEKIERTSAGRRSMPKVTAAKTPPIEYNKFEEVFNEKEGKKIEGAKGVAAINKALRNMEGMRGVKYRIDDNMQQVYFTDSESERDKILFEVKEGVDITEDLLNRARQRAVMKDGPLYTLEKQNTYAGKKKSGTTSSATIDTSGY